MAGPAAQASDQEAPLLREARTAVNTRLEQTTEALIIQLVTVRGNIIPQTRRTRQAKAIATASTTAAIT